ncbi:MAG: hypothetical protein E6H07_14150 [Bacteroidetes bacterium]|nr:MAG: hypothetical protein E6H07_14150 [Bacteroidota bacterium]
MKKLFNGFLVPVLIIMLMFAVVPLLAQQDDQDKKKEKKRYEHFKERNISKTYPASGNTLNIDNSFGNVIVTTGGSEIKVDIHIEASSTDKEHAEKIFSNIDVTDSKSGNQVKFKTTTNKNDNEGYNCKNCNSSMSINYTVQLPAGTSLNIENSFGDIKIPDYTGTVSLVSKFGSLTAGSLPKSEKVHVEFGKADIKSINNANTTFKFSKINVGNMSGSSKVNIEFCSASRIGLASDLTSFSMKESYSTINLKPAANFSASYNIKTSFGSFKNKTNAEIKRTDEPDRYGPDSEKTYEGKSGSGSSKIDIRSSFGNIILGDATEAELTEHEKGKNKSKSKVI